MTGPDVEREEGCDCVATFIDGRGPFWSAAGCPVHDHKPSPNPDVALTSEDWERASALASHWKAEHDALAARLAAAERDRALYAKDWVRLDEVRQAAEARVAELEAMLRKYAYLEVLSLQSQMENVQKEARALLAQTTETGE